MWGKSSAVNAVTYEEVCSEKKNRLNVGSPESLWGWDYRINSLCSTGERGAWHGLLPATPVSADCFGWLWMPFALCLTCFFAGIEFGIPWDCFAPSMLDDGIPLSCDSKPYIMYGLQEWEKAESPHTALG